MNHKWKDNVCVKCGLVRKPKPLSPNLLTYGAGKYIFDYFRNGVQQYGAKTCDKIIES